MKRFVLAAAAALAVGVPLAAGAETAPAPQLIFGVDRTDPAPPLQTVRYVWGGRNYCWYPRGWHGPGYYWCGYAWRRGYGWGGGEGWRGWRHDRGWHRGWDRRHHHHDRDRY